MSEKYRLVTRSDMDGLVCAALLKDMELVNWVEFVHPKDMQDGKIEIGPKDITTNLPYVEGVHLAFDHHYSETIRVEGDPENHVIDPDAPSAARVVYDYYGGTDVFPESFDAMMEAVDKADSAQFTRDEILHPRGWVLLSFLMDARTGLGRFKEFRLSNYQLMMELIEQVTTKTIHEILEDPDIKERIELYKKYNQDFQDQLRRCSKVEGNLVVVDLRKEEVIYPGNRFMIYALYPETNISMHIMWGRDQQNTVCAVGKSILRRDSKINVGELCFFYGGGGHQAAGTCQLDNDDADHLIDEIIDKIVSAG